MHAICTGILYCFVIRVVTMAVIMTQNPYWSPVESAQECTLGAKHRRDSSSLRSAAPPSLGAGAGHSFLPPDRRLGRSATPSRSNLPWSAELPTPSEAKTPSFGGTGGLFGCHADCDCIIVYSAVSSTPMTDGRHALQTRQGAAQQRSGLLLLVRCAK